MLHRGRHTTLVRPDHRQFPIKLARCIHPTSHHVSRAEQKCYPPPEHRNNDYGVDHRLTHTQKTHAVGGRQVCTLFALLSYPAA